LDSHTTALIECRHCALCNLYDVGCEQRKRETPELPVYPAIFKSSYRSWSLGGSSPSRRQHVVTLESLSQVARRTSGWFIELQSEHIPQLKRQEHEIPPC
jgi:hypothetical protein